MPIEQFDIQKRLAHMVEKRHPHCVGCPDTSLKKTLLAAALKE